MSKPKLSNYIALRPKTIAGHKFRIGERLPIGHISFAKLRQLEERGWVANAGEDAGRELAKKYEHAFAKKR